MIPKKKLSITGSAQQHRAQVMNKKVAFCPLFLMSYLIGKFIIFENANQYSRRFKFSKLLYFQRHSIPLKFP